MTAEPHYRTEKAAKRAEILDRRTQVAALLLSRVEQRDIAKRLGVALGTVVNDVHAVKAGWQKECAEHYDVLVARENAKLDMLERGCAAAAYTGDKDARDGMLKIADRRARLLGLDRPQRIEHTGAEGGPIEIVGLDELAAQAEADVLFLADHRKDTGTG